MDFYTNTCLATENFDEIYLKEYILKFSFNGQDLSNNWLVLYIQNIFEIFDFEKFYNLELSDDFLNNGEYTANINDFTTCSIILKNNESINWQ